MVGVVLRFATLDCGLDATLQAQEQLPTSQAVKEHTQYFDIILFFFIVLLRISVSCNFAV